MERDRIIADIESFEQALRVEETIRTGYCHPIIESLLAWIAVEEDLVSSYGKLAEAGYGRGEEEPIRKLSVESKENAEELHRLVKMIEGFAEASERRQNLILKLIQSK